MKFIECQQGTPEWLQARAGAITASCFADAISVLTRDGTKRKKGQPTAAAEKYAGDIAIERISGKPYGEPPKASSSSARHRQTIRPGPSRRPPNHFPGVPAGQTLLCLLPPVPGRSAQAAPFFFYSTNRSIS